MKLVNCCYIKEINLTKVSEQIESKRKEYILYDFV